MPSVSPPSAAPRRPPAAAPPAAPIWVFGPGAAGPTQAARANGKSAAASAARPRRPELARVQGRIGDLLVRALGAPGRLTRPSSLLFISRPNSADPSMLAPPWDRNAQHRIRG